MSNHQDWEHWLDANGAIILDRQAIIIDAHRRLGGRSPLNRQDKIDAVTTAAVAHGYDQPLWGWTRPDETDVRTLAYRFFQAYLHHYGSRYLDEV